MSRVKNKGSKIENVFLKELSKHKIRYRKNSLKYFGKPDVVLKRYKMVIFIDSCFWHGCREHGTIPKTEESFWRRKLERNMERDKEVSRHYKKIGWKVFRIWEHSLKNPERVCNKIFKVI